MQVPYHKATLEEANEVINEQLPVFLDTETCGFYGKVRLLQIMQEDWDSVIIVEWPDPMLLANSINWWHSVWHNAHYDVTTIQQQTETRWVPSRFDCSFLLARLAYPHKEKFDLDNTLKYVMGHDVYVGMDKKKLQKSNWAAQVLTDEQYLYAATDVYYMPELWKIIEGFRESQSYQLDMLTMKYCLDFQWNGMPVDKARLFSLYEANQAKVKAYNMPINVNSWQQVRPYIGEESSDALALSRFWLEDGNQKAKDVRDCRKLIKQNSFLDKFDTIDDRIFGKFKPSARSGRLTSNDQNLQQLPRKTKGVFGFPEGSDRVLIYSDYAQLELRTIAAILDVVLMVKMFREGVDLHGFTAEQLIGPNWTKDDRMYIKTYNFNYLYGGGIEMVQSILIKEADLLIDVVKLGKDRNKWRSLWREIYAWQERGIKAWKQGRLGSTPMGRKYKAKMMTDQLNIENQGAGAEVAKLALHYLYPQIMDDVKLVNFIHDSFILDAPNDPAVYEPMAEIVAKSMSDAWVEMSKLFKVKDVPMPVNVRVGYNWGDIEEDKFIWEYNL